MARRGGSLLVPVVITLLYLLASLVLCVLFRLLFAGEVRPIERYALASRLNSGILLYMTLFPALVMAALALPFGLNREEGRFTPFETGFLEEMRGPLYCAIGASVVYGFISLLGIPALENYQAGILFRSELYRTSLRRAVESERKGEWTEASYALSVCQSIWPESTALEEIAEDINEGLSLSRRERPAGAEAAAGTAERDLSGRRTPVNAAEALLFAEAAFAEERYYDAHWLANLAAQLARPGGAEEPPANRLAGQAWEAIAALEPEQEERERHALYRRKREGYEAMVGGDWLRAYYLFKDLSPLAGDDTDVRNFLARSTEGVLSLGFFIDDMRTEGAQVTLGAVLSLPFDAGGEGTARSGRLALRFESLSLYEDYGWVTGVEALAFSGGSGAGEREEKPLFAVSAPYAKLVSLETADGGADRFATRRRTGLLLRAFDRNDSSRRWEPEWTRYERASLSPPGGADLLLDISFDDLKLDLAAGESGGAFFLRGLFDAAGRLKPYGAIPEVYYAKITRRVTEPLFFLALFVFTLVAGWRLRARTPSLPAFIPMLAALPIVFAALSQAFRSFLDTLCVFATLNAPFPLPLLITGGAAVVMFVLSMIVLSAQHS